MLCDTQLCYSAAQRPWHIVLELLIVGMSHVPGARHAAAGAAADGGQHLRGGGA